MNEHEIKTGPPYASYPEIAKFVTALHGRRISTFLVTNAQFPDAIKALPAITQLYVSVDAATPETLKAIDRPLFGDYWVRARKDFQRGFCFLFFWFFFWFCPGFFFPPRFPSTDEEPHLPLPTITRLSVSAPLCQTATALAMSG